MARPRKFIGPLTQKQQAKKDHKKILKISKMITPAKKHTTSAFPNSMRQKEKYFDYKSSDGVYYGFLYNTNSTYNPQRLAGGHQPNARDQMVLIYNKYIVHSCTVVVKMVATVGTAFIGAVGAVNNATSAETDIRKVIETPGCQYKATSVNDGTIVLKRKVINHEVAGVSQLKYETDDIYSANVGADPAEIMTAGIYYTKVDGTNLSSGYVYAEICLTYDVTYYDPIILGMS